jgi:hypothetical protein
LISCDDGDDEDEDDITYEKDNDDVSDMEIVVI